MVGDTMEYPVFYLECSTKNDVSLFSKTVNRVDIDDTIWIHFPNSLSHDLTLFDISQVSPLPGVVRIDDTVVDQLCKRPWIKIKTYALDMSIGYHLYCLKFLHKHTEDVVKLYTSYTIYDSMPNKPYIYMNQGKEGK